MKNKNVLTSAFTLIELLIVIAIIGVIMAISLFGLAGARESARDGRRKSDLEQIRSALELYRADCGVYPASITFGSALRGANASGNTCLNSFVYIQVVPVDPGSGTYRYNRVSNTTYELCATQERPANGAAAVSCAGNSTCGAGHTCYFKVVNP